MWKYQRMNHYHMCCGAFYLPVMMVTGTLVCIPSLPHHSLAMGYCHTFRLDHGECPYSLILDQIPPFSNPMSSPPLSGDEEVESERTRAERKL
jgi:hypothetical protein